MEGMKGANPFLMMENEDTMSPKNNSNPFLMDNTDFTGSTAFSDNPFLSNTCQTAETVTSVNNVVSTGNATNPFAFDPVDFAPSDIIPDKKTHCVLSKETNDFFGQNITNDIEPTAQSTNDSITDFFSMDNNEQSTNTCPTNVESAPVVQKPDVLDLKHTHTVSNNGENINLYFSDEELNKIPPKRPPPPRPVIPPSKETKELIMSVTGAMDATSSHLLDRIPPTRTPSPVSMRDLHSPSPTPEHTFADFLDVGSVKSHPTNNTEVDLFDLSNTDDCITSIPAESKSDDVANNIESFMGLMSQTTNPVCDINQNHSVRQELPVRPPRPQPPQKPPPPMFKSNPPQVPSQKNEPQQSEQTVFPKQILMEPQQAAAGAPPPVQPNDDMMDMLGDSNLPSTTEKLVPEQTKPVASTADIMSLYSTPIFTKSEPIEDFLCEATDINMTALPDTLISPELSSQHEIHMDTSDTQSKGSGSSVTFNPFASEDTVVSATIIDTSSNSPQKTHDDSLTQNSMFVTSVEVMNTNIISSNDIKNSTPQIQNDSVLEKSDDDFDDFAAKFESAKDESKNAFDAFGGNGNSAWGTVDNDKGFASGFDADEPFDAFLSLQEPPAVPQGTPSMLSKRESQESDEDKDFSVFIKQVI